MTCAQAPWPARPWSGPIPPASTGRPMPSRRSRGCFGRARPRSSRRPPTMRRSRPSTSWPVRAGGWRRRPPMWRWSPHGPPSAVPTGEGEDGAGAERGKRASRRRFRRTVEVDGRNGRSRRGRGDTTDASRRPEATANDGPSVAARGVTVAEWRPSEADAIGRSADAAAAMLPATVPAGSTTT